LPDAIFRGFAVRGSGQRDRRSSGFIRQSGSRYGEDAKRPELSTQQGTGGRKIVGTKEEGMQEGIAHVRRGEGRSLWVLGELITFKTTSERTGGAYSLFEVISQPRGGRPPHVQHREDESFWVLEGEYEFLVEGNTMRVGAGFLLYVPKGTLHAHKNVGDKPSRMLVNQTPGGLHERFFEEIGEPAMDGSEPPTEGPQDMERIVAIAVKYGIEIAPSVGR
jgi:mannose-6-phosphate isomerase-like protein (cupin superfamily)